MQQRRFEALRYFRLLFCTTLFFPLILSLAACDVLAAVNTAPVDPSLAKLEVASPKTPELIFSAVKATRSEPKQVSLRNIGTGPLEVTALTFSGPDASAFTVSGADLPMRIEAGSSRPVGVAFAPVREGTHEASLQIESASGSLNLALYGLSSKGEQGSNEPPLEQVVTTLGYSVDVGSSNLELGEVASSIGDEVLTPLFQKAGSGPVMLEVVARYGPNELFPYGYFILAGEEPILEEVGTIAAEDAQELLPPVASGSITFDPGAATFGIYGQASGTTQYTVDSLNSGEIRHAMRVYPLKDRSGEAVANSYLIGLEEAQNGDYQDVLFVLKNVAPSPVTPP